jgi:hypothetical protein
MWFHRVSIIDSDHPRGHWLLERIIYERMFYNVIGIDIGLAYKNI